MTMIATPIAGGYSWTLTSRLGHMLQLAQQQHGTRDHSYTILGIEFEADGPKIWYPGHSEYISIQLTPDTQTNMLRGCYQLAHECVHLLSPTGKQNGNILEEGLATHFAHQYVVDEFRTDFPPTNENYETARQLVHELLAIDQNAIRTLRLTESVISKITASQIIAQFPSIANATAIALGSPFSYAT